MKRIFSLALTAILAVALLVPAFAASTLDNGLVIYYDFENNEVKDLKGNNTIAGVSADRFVDGKKGKGLSFNGTAESVLTSDLGSNPNLTLPNPNSSYSVSVWMKSDCTQDGAIFCFGSFAAATGTWGFVQAGSTNACVANYDANDGFNCQYGYAWNYDEARYADKAVKLDDGNWHNVIFVYDFTAKAAVIYIDGFAYDKGALEDPMKIDPADNYIRIGGRGGDTFYKGTLDDVRIYNRAITAAEADEIANGSKTPAPDTGDIFTAVALVTVACGAALVFCKKH